ncbi:MAG: hypothetical protein DRO01_05345 [Thermoproteota archaeon]|nr:MAG: hypothetical protein DRO01_05345 [Candidatus Korarchaeota archaeon]
MEVESPGGSESRFIRMIGLRLPMVNQGDDLAELIVEAAAEAGERIEDGDVIVVASKVVSRAKGYVVNPNEVKFGLRSRLLAWLTGREPWEIELIRRGGELVFIMPFSKATRGTGFPELCSVDPTEARRMVESAGDVMLMRVRGLTLLDAGMDYSNCPEGHVCLLPPDPDAEAREIADRIEELTGAKVGVVLSDTEFQPMKIGSIDVAVGVANIFPIRRRFGARDYFGRPKFGGDDSVADELAAAAALLMGQADEGIPVVLFKGVDVEFSREASSEIWRAPSSKVVRVVAIGALKTLVAKLLRLA